ncbi:ABC transporter substrate-binding protein, partial [Burkholderia cenocepacia]|nr:ABC transporter substrate-binding protein [Burkholderia cenocepacia]
MGARRFAPRRRSLLAGAAAGALAGALPGGAFAQGAAAAPKRVIVIGGALAETAFALGADTTCTYPDAAKRLPKVGYQRALSAEGLLSLRPDLVLASAEAGPPTAIAQVKGAGITVTTFDERLGAGMVQHEQHARRLRAAGHARG